MIHVYELVSGVCIDPVLWDHEVVLVDAWDAPCRYFDHIRQAGNSYAHAISSRQGPIMRDRQKRATD